MTRACVAVVAAALVGCGARSAPVAAVSAAPRTLTASDRLVGLLPDGAQVICEIDLARLRGNAVIGEVVGRALDEVALSADVELPMQLPSSPLAKATAVVLAAYGVGTAQAATVTLVATPGDVPGGTRVADGVVALAPDAWVAQVSARAGLAATGPLGPSAELVALREHAQPAGATGAALRLTARLSFDARIALARQTGVELAPAQLSVWADVADDLAVVVDADAGAEPARKLAAVVRGALGELADAGPLRALGLPGALRDARQVRQGTWIRTVIAVGPARLRRAVSRANELLGPRAAPTPPAEGSAS